jgi:outer membrane biosynthesis protein TonB
MPPVRVTLEFVVDQGGRVEQHTARVVRSTDGRLNRSFEYWVTDCRFRPGKIQGRAVRVRMQREWEIQPAR